MSALTKISTGRLVVLLSLTSWWRVELGHRHGMHTCVGEELIQHPFARHPRRRRASSRVLAKRRVEKVHQVDVEVDSQHIACGEG